VLFFVSVGMLIDPAFLFGHILEILAVVAIVMIGKSLAAQLIVRLLGGPLLTGLTVAAGLSQFGVFSFILAEMGRSLSLLSEDGVNLVLAAALVTITLNPPLFRLIDPIRQRLGPEPAPAPASSDRHVRNPI
jgi:CPA2 family monovalent cation:H+ antiporter-2